MNSIRITVPGTPQGKAKRIMPFTRPAIDRWRDGYDVVNECWIWRGAKDRKGYARFRDSDGRTVSVHRFAYQNTVGEIPDGMVLDHLCRNPGCCNPAHLEPVTNAENIRRGRQGQPQLSRTHCPKGHPYDDANTLRYRANERLCRECQRLNWRKQESRRQAARSSKNG
jgi:hypothetical protein